MSDNSLESAVDTATSEPVTDVKETAVESEPEAPVEAKAEPEATEEATEEKKLTKAEEVEKKLESTKAGMQKRIDRQTAASKAKDEKLQYLTEQVEKLTPTDVDNSPKESDYETWEEYLEADKKYSNEKAVESYKLESMQQEREQLNRQKLEEGAKAFQARVSEFRATTTDYSEKEAQFNEIATDLISQKGESDPTMAAISEVLMDSEVAPRLIYELGSNPDLAEDLANMTPIQAQREIFKMEIGFSNEPKKETSKLPEPIKPVGNKGSSSKSLTNMSGAELKKRLGL